MSDCVKVNGVLVHLIDIRVIVGVSHHMNNRIVGDLMKLEADQISLNIGQGRRITLGLLVRYCVYTSNRAELVSLRFIAIFVAMLSL